MAGSTCGSIVTVYSMYAGSDGLFCIKNLNGLLKNLPRLVRVPDNLNNRPRAFNDSVRPSLRSVAPLHMGPGSPRSLGRGW